jgi:hypothetical protein
MVSNCIRIYNVKEEENIVWKHWDHAWFATKNLLDERIEESFSF